MCLILLDRLISSLCMWFVSGGVDSEVLMNIVCNFDSCVGCVDVYMLNDVFMGLLFFEIMFIL